jgi:hypothetical protein
MRVLRNVSFEIVGQTNCGLNPLVADDVGLGLWHELLVGKPPLARTPHQNLFARGRDSESLRTIRKHKTTPDNATLLSSF